MISNGLRSHMQRTDKNDEMDVYTSYRGQAFVWNAKKASDNRAKDGVSFETACEVFFDPLARYIDASVPEEERLAVLGRTLNGRLLFVVNIEEYPESTRIISARPAQTADRTLYEEPC